MEPWHLLFYAFGGVFIIVGFVLKALTDKHTVKKIEQKQQQETMMNKIINERKSNSE